MKKNNLFELIQSMSKSEKRHFKLSSSRFSDKEKKYVKMFDVINDQKSYNEQEVKAQLKKMVHEKNFAVEKKLLVQLFAQKFNGLPPSKITQF